jgi:hypothetical protein
MKKRQIDVIADILTERGHIDNFYAIETKLTYRLAARVADLRALGWEIETKEMPNKNTYYRLVKKPGAKQLALGGVASCGVQP